MAEIPLGWRLSIQGAEEVRSKLADVNEQFRRGEISTADYSKELRSVSRDARAFVSIQNVQKNLFLATHPTLNNLTRAMSVFGSVLRAVSTTMILINTAQIALNTQSANTAQSIADVRQAQRELDDAVKDFGPDSKQAIEAMDKLNVANAALEESIRQAEQQSNSFWLSLLVGVSQVATAVILALPKILPFITSLGSLAIPAAAISGLAAIAGLFIAIPAAILAAGAFISDFLIGLFGLDEWRKNNGKMFEEFFLVTIPNALAALPAIFTNVWNTIVTVTEGFINTIIGGVETLVNSFISIVNTMISAYNNVASALSLPKLSTLSAVSLPRADFGTLASPESNLSGAVSTLGPQHAGGTGGGGSTIIVNVEGSIITENELLEKVDESLKDKLRRRNFR